MNITSLGHLKAVSGFQAFFLIDISSPQKIHNGIIMPVSSDGWALRFHFGACDLAQREVTARTIPEVYRETPALLSPVGRLP